MQQKNEKLALIAGVENPIGVAVARELRGAGWKVVGLDYQTTAAVAKELDRSIKLDMTNRKKFIEVIADVERSQGEINALFCATGFGSDMQCTDFLETSIEQWEKSLDGWLGSSINACYAVAPGMVLRQRGRIIILSPDYSRETQDRVLTAVGAGTLHGFAKSFGVEMAKENVLVNCLWPNTPFDLEAIAKSVCFLADSGNYVSAQVISIQGLENGVLK